MLSSITMQKDLLEKQYTNAWIQVTNDYLKWFVGKDLESFWGASNTSFVEEQYEQVNVG